MSPAASAFVAVIDDNQQLRGLVVRALTGVGYRVKEWGNPETAIEQLAQISDEVALVVLDGVMPQMTGPRAADRIFETHPHVPVLLMSGHEAPMFEEFFGKPGHHFIAKPFVVEDFLARVGAIIGPPEK
ncbi:MAG TPA: response regulator [Gemmatimonadaceae bacterium]